MIFTGRQKFELSRIVKALLYRKPYLISFSDDAFKVVSEALENPYFEQHLQDFLYVWNGMGLRGRDLSNNRLWGNRNFQLALLELLDRLDELQDQMLINETNLKQPSGVGEPVQKPPSWLKEIGPLHPNIRIKTK